MKITILGTGNMGTAMAHLISNNKHQVVLWGIDKEAIDSINKHHENFKALSGLKLPSLVSATLNLKEALRNSQAVILAVPTQATAKVMQEAKPFVTSKMIFLGVSKGIENQTGCLITQIIKNSLPKKTRARVGVLMGPLFASEISKKIPSLGIAAIFDEKDFKILKNILENDYFFVKYSNDVIGAELGGALKNIYAILLGVCDGLDYGWNTKSAIMVAAINEMAEIGYYLGGKKETLYGLAGVGDLLTTGFGEKSRNRRFGEKLCSKKTVKRILSEIDQVVEGAETLKIVIKLLAKFKKRTPLLQAIYKIVQKRENPQKVFKGLLKKI